MFFRVCAASLCGVLLAACSGSTGNVPAGSPVAFEQPVFSLTEMSAGPIAPGTAYSQNNLQELFPDFTFQTVRTMTEGDVVFFIAGFKDGFQVFQAEPNTGNRTVARVHVVGPRAEGPNGERIGMTFAETNGGAMDCTPGAEEWSGMAICKRTESRVSFIYAPEQYTGPDGQLPSRPELRNARIVRMVWDGRS